MCVLSVVALPICYTVGVFVSDLQFLNCIFMFNIVTWLRSQNHRKNKIRDFTSLYGQAAVSFLVFQPKSGSPLSPVIQGSEYRSHPAWVPSGSPAPVTAAPLLPCARFPSSDRGCSGGGGGGHMLFCTRRARSWGSGHSGGMPGAGDVTVGGVSGAPPLPAACVVPGGVLPSSGSLPV